MMKLAKVESASLEIKERGILNFWVQVAYEDGFHQGVGGLTLDDWDKRLERRIGTAYGCEMIRQLLLFFGVNNLNEAKGQVVYVVGEGSGLAFKPTGFKHLNILKGSRPDHICFNEIAKEFIKE
jgi:hypothetical protein